MRGMLIIVLALAACATPYQQMGFSGGYEETAISDLVYIVHVKVNAFTDQGTAIAYAYRRAAELCPGGYQVENSAASASVSLWRTSYGYQEMKKPEITIAVRCGRPSPPPPAPPPVAHDAPAVVRWWCVTHSGGQLGLCSRTRDLCEQQRETALITDAKASNCEPRRVAMCFGIAFAGLAGSDDMCLPTAEACVHQRDFVIAHPDKATALTECRPID